MEPPLAFEPACSTCPWAARTDAGGGGEIRATMRVVGSRGLYEHRGAKSRVRSVSAWDEDRPVCERIADCVRVLLLTHRAPDLTHLSCTSFLPLLLHLPTCQRATVLRAGLARRPQKQFTSPAPKFSSARPPSDSATTFGRHPSRVQTED